MNKLAVAFAGAALLASACAPSAPDSTGKLVPLPTARPAQESGVPNSSFVQQHTMRDGWTCFTYRDKLQCGK